MKKRFLSLLMALCLMLSLAPAAFAADNQPDTIALPNGEVREIPDITPADTPMSMSINNTSGTTYTITSEAQFADLDASVWYGNNTIKIACDLNLADPAITKPSEWGGYIQYFYGTLEGVKGIYDETGVERDPIISGINNNCSFIYGIIGGTIQNLTFKHTINGTAGEGGSASFITFMPVNLDGHSYHLKMQNIAVTGSISLTGSDQSNYAPFVYCAPGGGLTMEGCVNSANITGSIYGSIFHGYYPLSTGTSCKYEFTDCTNNGNVTMQYAGMFFGNSSSVEGKVSSDTLYLTITDCQNNGTIRGTSGAKYFAAPVSEFETNMEAVENILKPADSSAVSSNTLGNIHVDRITGTGSLCIKNPLAGFAAVLNNDRSITVTRATDESNISYYVVSISAYVNMLNKGSSSFAGTDRYTVTETFNKNSLTSNTFTPELMAYGFADSNLGDEDFDILNYKTRYGSDGKTYYDVMNGNLIGNQYYRYVSDQIANGMPVGGGSKDAEIVTVGAYSSTGELVDLRTLR